MKQKRATRTASLTHENQYLRYGCRNIMGLDEAGRGTWAGPLVVGAVCLPLGRKDLSNVLAGVRDSKQMTARQRSLLVERIKETAVAWGVGSAAAEEIDRKGINPATRLAMARALANAAQRYPDFQPDCLFLDSLPWPESPVQKMISIVKGDTHSLSIAAASVLAKVWRDDAMRELDRQYPQYGFAAHKGYGTKKHQAALKTYGASPQHRMTFAPLRKLHEHTG